MHCVTSRSSEASEPLRHEMWLTVGWRLEGILFERIWKLMSAGWMWGKSQLSLCFLSVSRASADEFTDMRVSLSGLSPSRVMIEIKNDFCWPLAAAWRGGKTEEDFKVIWDATAGILKEQLSVHKLLEMTFTPSSPQTCGRWFVLFMLFLLWTFSFSSFFPFHSCAFNTLQTLPFVFYTHDWTEKPPKTDNT